MQSLLFVQKRVNALRHSQVFKIEMAFFFFFFFFPSNCRKERTELFFVCRCCRITGQFLAGHRSQALPHRHSTLQQWNFTSAQDHPSLWLKSEMVFYAQLSGCFPALPFSRCVHQEMPPPTCNHHGSTELKQKEFSWACRDWAAGFYGRLNLLCFSSPDPWRHIWNAQGYTGVSLNSPCIPSAAQAHSPAVLCWYPKFLSAAFHTATAKPFHDLLLIQPSNSCWQLLPKHNREFSYLKCLVIFSFHFHNSRTSVSSHSEKKQESGICLHKLPRKNESEKSSPELYLLAFTWHG